MNIITELMKNIDPEDQAKTNIEMMEKHINYLEAKVKELEARPLETLVSGTKNKADLINAISNAMLANKSVGDYTDLKRLCIEKLTLLINEIE